MNIFDIPFVKHIAIQEEEKRLVLEQSYDVENHIQTIHAAAQFALAESQSGFYLQSLFPEYTESVLPLLRSSTIKYRQPATKKISAIAQVDKKKQKSFKEQFLKKGRATITIYVELVDSNDIITMTGEFTWFVQKLDQK